MNREVLRERMKTLLSHPLIPEPQGSNLIKSQIEWNRDCSDQNAALVSHCNANGIELKNYVSYLTDGSSKEDGISTPVLNSSHFNGFENIEDITVKLAEMPPEWTIVLITKGFDPMDVVGSTKNQRKDDPTIFMHRMACGPSPSCSTVSVVIPPKGNIVSEANIVQRLEDLQQGRRAYYKNHRDSKLAAIHKSSDSTIESYIREVDIYWLREWKCLLTGRLVDSILEKKLRNAVAKLTEKIIGNNRSGGDRKMFRDSNKFCEILYLLTLSAHYLKDNDIFKALKYSFYGQDYSGDASDLEILVDELKSLNVTFSGVIKSSEKYPVILILDSYFEVIPWEISAVLSGNPVSRVRSLPLLYALFKYHESEIRHGYKEVIVNSAFCLLNPSKDLKECEERIGDFLRTKLPWVEVMGGLAPQPDKLSTKLQDVRLYLYCGHGSGTHFFPSGCIGKTIVSSIAFLYGCCSNLPQGLGGRTPYQNSVYTYLLNGCSCLIGAIYDVNSNDADLACMKTLSYLFCDETANEGSRDVLQALLLGKAACKRSITKAALVARGIPAKVTYKAASVTS